MKFTLCITRNCNLRCDYCYIGKSGETMTPDTAHRAIDLLFRLVPRGTDISIGFFGGEPLMEMGILRQITGMIAAHASYDPEHVEISVTSNGTILSEEIAGYLKAQGIRYCLSCDGPPAIHDRHRPFTSGEPSGALLEKNIPLALKYFGDLLVNAVIGPDTVGHLPETVEWFSALGVRRIYATPDYSARWDDESLNVMAAAMERTADLYIRYYMEGRPHYINPIDGKIAVMLRGGFASAERCQMGVKELAVAPSGTLYPCERLIGADDGTESIGNVHTGMDITKLACGIAAGRDTNPECLDCGVRQSCVFWCGCSNKAASGFYNRVNNVICSHEKALMSAALRAFKAVEGRFGAVFLDHIAGRPSLNSYRELNGVAAWCGGENSEQ